MQAFSWGAEAAGLATSVGMCLVPAHRGQSLLNRWPTPAAPAPRRTPGRDRKVELRGVGRVTTRSTGHLVAVSDSTPVIQLDLPDLSQDSQVATDQRSAGFGDQLHLRLNTFQQHHVAGGFFRDALRIVDPLVPRPVLPADCRATHAALIARRTVSGGRTKCASNRPLGGRPPWRRETRSGCRGCCGRGGKAEKRAFVACGTQATA